jgi:hypothetical protein
MRFALAKSVFATVLTTVMLSAAPPACGESVFDKLKKQAKDSLDQNKKQAQKTVEDSAGVDTSQSPASYRADLEQKWKACYGQMMTSSEYQQCASICNAARQSIADSEPASLGNKATWQRCQDSHAKALSSAPARKLSAKEKAQGLPAGALPGWQKVESTAKVGGVDVTNASAVRADTERMRSECQARRKEGNQFGYCATTCSQSSQKIYDASNGIADNGVAWQKCKGVYDSAMGVAKVVNGDTSAPAAKPDATTAPIAAPATTKTAQKPAAKPAPKSSLTATAADKAAADKYAQQCAANYHLSGTYDCQCMREKYLAASLVVREKAIQTWETTGEPYLRDQIDRAKAAGKDSKFPQKRYDEGKTNAYATPRQDEVSLQLTSNGGEAPLCYSQANIAKTKKAECLSGNWGKKTAMGTPIDGKYCACFSEKYADAMLNGTDGGQVTGVATSACDTESPLYKMQAGK